MGIEIRCQRKYVYRGSPDSAAERPPTALENPILLLLVVVVVVVVVVA